MSRHLLPSQRRQPSISETSHYPVTSNNHQPPHHHHHQQQQQQRLCHQSTAEVVTVSDDDDDNNSSLPINQQFYYNETEQRYINEYFSDDGSTSLRLYENNDFNDDNEQNNEFRRLSRNTFISERSYNRRYDKIGPAIHQEPQPRRAYNTNKQQYTARFYHEIQQQQPQPQQTRAPPASDRPQSSISSAVTTSAITDGCGGKCPTFENVCYFFLQLIFMMGILIGVSLCIAGLVLRKSAAKNLQVLVYIGILLAIVSGVLLGIQWNARNNARKRRTALRNAAKRAPIPLETFGPITRGGGSHHQITTQLQQRGGGEEQQQMVMVQEGQRVVPQIVRGAPQSFQLQRQERQGIPWWRRKDLD